MTTKNIQRFVFYPIFILSCTIFYFSKIYASPNNGFDLSDSLISIDDIHHGGPPKNGIPALDHPRFITAEKSNIKANMRVLGLSLNGVTKAYPINILNYHEIVNDFYKNQAVVVSYCPLCGSGTAYLAKIKQKNLSFGVSGLLYNSDVLLYDRETESLWSQLLSQAVTGDLKGTKLKLLNLEQTTWQDWLKRYPNTLVLSDKTGFMRDYSKTPYDGYNESKHLYFPVKSLNKAYHPKEYTLGLTLNGQYKAYPFAELSKTTSPLIDQFAGQTVKIIFNATQRTGYILDQKDQPLPSITSFWFAWMGFYPNSTVYHAK